MFTVKNYQAVPGISSARTTRSSWLLLGLLLFFLLGHLPFLASPFVNLEFSYAESAELLSQGKLADSLRHLEEQIANPIGTSAAVAAFYRVFDFSEASSRLYSLAAGLALILVVFSLGRPSGLFFGWRDARRSLLAAALIALNPMFFVYSGLVGSDVPFVFLAACSVFVAVAASHRDSLLLYGCSALLISAAALTKYNAIAFVPVLVVMVVVESLRDHRPRRQQFLRLCGIFAVFGAVAGGLVLSYLLYARAVLGHILSPEYVEGFGVQPNAATLLLAPGRLAALVVWLGLFTGPFLFIPFWHLYEELGARGLTSLALGLLGAACLGGGLIIWFESHYDSFGETQLGWIRHFLHGGSQLWLANTLLCLAGGFVVAGFIAWCLRDVCGRYVALVWMLSFLAVHSLVTPSNRYVLFALPPLAFYLADRLGDGLERKGMLSVRGLFALAGCLLFACVSIFNSAYYSVEGRAAARVAAFVNEKHLPVPSSGTVQVHCLYLIDPQNLVTDDRSAPYQLLELERNESHAGVLFESPVEIGGIVFKRYVVARQ